MASCSSSRGDMQQQMKLELSKGMEVEVTIKDEGFKDSWYSATIVKAPCSSSSSKKRRNKKKAMVEYHNLVTERGSKPLREYVSPALIRPFPPPSYTDNHSSNSRRFEEDDVVDAFYNEGWWTGVVCRVLEHDRFRVYFDYPPDVLEFELQNLRVHQKWIDGKWVHSEKQQKQQSTKSIFSSGQEVEVNIDEDEDEEASTDIWFTAIVIKEIQGSYLVKCKSCGDGDESEFLKVAADHVRPIPPRWVDRYYFLLEKVEAVYEFGWRIGEIYKVSADGKYEVFFRLGQESVLLDHTKLRPHMRWIGDKWIIISESETTISAIDTKERKGMPPNIELKMLKNLPAGKVGSEGTAAVALLHANEVVTSESYSSMGSVPKAKEATYQHEEVNSNDKKRQRPSKSNTTSPIPLEAGFSGEKAVKRCRTFNGSKSKMTAAESSNTPGDEIMPLWLLADKEDDQHAETPQFEAPQEFSSVNNTKDNVSNMNTPLPFVKRSPVWKTLESMEVFKLMSQQPHFLPLGECNECCREGNAIGMMVTFSSIAEKVSKLKFDDPRSTFSSALDILSDLEKYGFDVNRLKNYVRELLGIKDRLSMLQEEARASETKMTELAENETKLADEVSEIEMEINVLQERLLLVKSRMKKASNDIDSLRSGLKSSSAIIHDIMLGFGKVVGSPFQK